jgi:prepilin-type N-terminal cleavage/methylation domain-containing protein
MSQPQPSRFGGEGFTLIELAIVITIIGLIVGTLIPAWFSQAANQRIASTKTGADMIKSALISFISRNNRLPCPANGALAVDDPNYGSETTPPGTCTGAIVADTSVRGIVPWLSLGLSEPAASDAYIRRFSYQVTTSQTNLNATTLPGMRGTITIHGIAPIQLGLAPTGNQVNACSTTAGDNSCNIASIVAIVSHGENGFGAFLPSGAVMSAANAAREAENADNDANLVRADYSNNPIDPFDDILLTVTPDELIGGLIQAGSIQSARALTSDTIQRTADALFNLTANAGGAVPAMIAPPIPVDAWGNPLTYARLVANVCGAPGIDAFTIRSDGLDGIAGNGDDVVFSQRSAPIKTVINNQGTPCL